MTLLQTHLDLYEPGMYPELFTRPSLFLSASDPREKGPVLLRTPAALALNQEYYQTRQPARIRDAVSHLCRFTFARGLQLIFGGHPAISPLVLNAARRFQEPVGAQRLVVVFQSAFFFDEIPPETLALGDWDYGTLLWTARRPATEVLSERDASLGWMRRVMVQSPNLLGAIFIGGMDGVDEEAQLFREHHPDRPMFAIGSTGSAAARLLESRSDVTGQAADVRILRHHPSYPLVMERIFTDLGWLRPRTA